jgi:hypothetical protein
LSKLRTLEELRAESDRTPHRAHLEFDKVRECWSFVLMNGNRRVERGPDFETKAKARYGMHQRFSGTAVVIWDGAR